MLPLLLDVALSDMYLLDNVSIRLRLEFASDLFLIDTDIPVIKPQYLIPAYCT